MSTHTCQIPKLEHLLLRYAFSLILTSTYCLRLKINLYRQEQDMGNECELL